MTIRETAKKALQDWLDARKSTFEEMLRSARLVFPDSRIRYIGGQGLYNGDGWRQCRVDIDNGTDPVMSLWVLEYDESHDRSLCDNNW